MMKLDKKDFSLLAELDKDARQTNKQLARKLKLSEQAIGYRIDRLIENKVINYFQLTIDPAKLSYTHFKLYLKLQNISNEEEKEMIEYLKRKNTLWVCSLRGHRDLIASMWAKDVFEFREFYIDLKDKFGSYIYDEDFAVVMDARVYNRNYLNGELEKQSSSYGGKKTTIDLDDIDKKILTTLSNNARLSFVELSKILKINADTIRYRYLKLKESGAILNSRLSINHGAIGRHYTLIWFYLHNFNAEVLKRMEEFSESVKPVIYYVNCIGEHNIEIEFETKDDDELDQIVKAYRDKFHKYIKNYSLLTVKKEHKLRFVPL